MRFKSKVVEIDAMQYNGKNFVDLELWARQVGPETYTALRYDAFLLRFEIKTLEGPLTVSVGDWIICGTEKEFYACKPSVFERKYEQVISPPDRNPEVEPL
jgi:hypothetical protein